MSALVSSGIVGWLRNVSGPARLSEFYPSHTHHLSGFLVYLSSDGIIRVFRSTIVVLVSFSIVDIGHKLK